MKILLTNDDGIQSPGLKALKDTLKSHDVWVVAPNMERSGASHSITVENPVLFKQIEDKTYSCTGNPADCVLYSMLGAIDFKPDLVISGINIGANLGTDIIYSGTVAGARQAAFMGIPAVAFSLASRKRPLFFEPVAEFCQANIELLLKLWEPSRILNINFPNLKNQTGKVLVTTPCRRYYDDHIVKTTSPSGDNWFFLGGSAQSISRKGDDAQAVKAGNISVCPIMIQPAPAPAEQELLNANFVLNGCMDGC